MCIAGGRYMRWVYIVSMWKSKHVERCSGNAGGVQWIWATIEALLVLLIPWDFELSLLQQASFELVVASDWKRKVAPCLQHKLREYAHRHWSCVTVECCRLLRGGGRLDAKGRRQLPSCAQSVCWSMPGECLKHHEVCQGKSRILLWTVTMSVKTLSPRLFVTWSVQGCDQSRWCSLPWRRMLEWVSQRIMRTSSKRLIVSAACH